MHPAIAYSWFAQQILFLYYYQCYPLFSYKTTVLSNQLELRSAVDTSRKKEYIVLFFGLKFPNRDLVRIWFALGCKSALVDGSCSFYQEASAMIAAGGILGCNGMELLGSLDLLGFISLDPYTK